MYTTDIFFKTMDLKIKDEYYELRKVLEAASTKEKTVILTSLNEAWAEPNSMFDIFLKSFRVGNNTAPLVDHLLAIAVDEKAYLRCKKLISHCYFLKTKQSSQMANEARSMTPIYLNMMWERLAFLQTVLKLGYNFIFTVISLSHMKSLCNFYLIRVILSQCHVFLPIRLCTLGVSYLLCTLNCYYPRNGAI